MPTVRMGWIVLAWVLALTLLGACAPVSVTPPSTLLLPTLAQLPSLTPSHTATATHTPSITPTATATATASITYTPSHTPTVTVTFTPSQTITDTPTRTPSMTPTPTATVHQPSGLELLAQLAVQSTVQPSPLLVYATPVANPLPIAPFIPTSAICSQPSTGGFAIVQRRIEGTSQQMGCPLGIPYSSSVAVQPFQSGLMLWVEWVNNQRGTIFALNSQGRYLPYADTFQAGIDPESYPTLPPSGGFAPMRGFGKVYFGHADLANSLGWATSPEVGETAMLQQYEQGFMVALPQRGEIWTLHALGTWSAFVGQF
ncbi:MAG: hypothetical protein ACOYLB_16020 [Phototrophicaceae bacterium]